MTTLRAPEIQCVADEGTAQTFEIEIEGTQYRVIAWGEDSAWITAYNFHYNRDKKIYGDEKGPI